MVEGEEKKEIKKGNKKEEKQAPLSTVNRLCRAGLMFRFLFIIVWSKPATFIKLLGRNQQRSLNCLVETNSVLYFTTTTRYLLVDQKICGLVMRSTYCFCALRCKV